ncbi:MAG TPA: DUF3566 domain-containing protein, partial [Acidimicrobiales bacterium]
MTGPDGGTTGSDPGVTAANTRPQEWPPVAERGVEGGAQRDRTIPPDEAPWSTFTPATPSPTDGAATPSTATTPPIAAPPPIGPQVDPEGTEALDAGPLEASPARRLAARVRPRRDPNRKARRGLRVRQRLWSIDPWSVFKLSALFYICVCLIVVVAGTLLWNVGRSVGTIDDVEGFITRMGAYGTCTLKA